MAAEQQSQPRADERQSDLAVMEANEYKQKRRLERILDAHDRVEDAAAEAFEQYAYGEIGEHAKNVVLLQAVKQYIREVYQLLNQYAQERFADDTDEDGMDGEKPGYLYRDGSDPLGVIARDHEHDIVFRDLSDVLSADTTYTETWTETTTTRHGHTETTEHERQYSVPESVSWNAYLLTNRFLSEEHDLELQFEELGDTLPTWGFEEVPDEEGTEKTAPSLQDKDGSEGVTADGDD